ncbi:hypothetical protein JOC78_002763 [Bacillus ectoiniformans]|uniref:hypothetical protein n=1 Tax=Bacillus ectoiniformans TaxID=1494429 RepID=UPI00195F05D9|nr:hypothetical protein [Bacillus ectoiniformans]MBM7649779.1 hypothetical protein [Bacillus ectoiniformans]
MKKFLKFILFTVILLAGLGFAAFYFGTNLASEKVMDAVTTELENSGQKEEVKAYIENDPELKKFVEEAETADESKLPFTTKEEATRVLVKKVGVSELKNIQSKVQEGSITKDEVLQMMQKDLTEEEIAALKVIAYKELYNK